MGWTMKKIRRSEVKRGGIKMRGNKGGALGNIYIYPQLLSPDQSTCLLKPSSAST